MAILETHHRVVVFGRFGRFFFDGLATCGGKVRYLGFSFFPSQRAPELLSGSEFDHFTYYLEAITV